MAHTLRELAEQFIEELLQPPLLHGDDKHQDWLKAELRAQVPKLERLLNLVDGRML